MRKTLFVFTGIVFILTGLVYIAGGTPGQPQENPVHLALKETQSGSPADPILFAKEEDAENFHLTYGWKGFYEVSYLLTFSLSKRSLEESEGEVGYVPAELDRLLEERLAPLRVEMIEYLRDYTEKEIKKSRFSRFFTIVDTDALSFNIRISAPPESYAEVKAEFGNITRRIAVEQERYYKKLEKERNKNMEDYLEERGLRYSDGKISVNYGEMVQFNRKRLRPVVLKIRELNRKTGLNIFLTTLLSYIQKITYGIPDMEEGGRFVLGFWPPLKVLANNFGDCDSKSVVFASSWVNVFRYPLLLIKIPNHMFIGLAVPTHQESGVRINGLRYTLCEVTGPDMFPPGLISSYSQMYIQSGRFTYELIR